jgi:hypothetical protein
MNDLDQGKVVFATFSDAEKTAIAMKKLHGAAFSVYKVEDGWAIGGVHLKKKKEPLRKKSLIDLKLLLDEYKAFENDNSVEDYIHDVVAESEKEHVESVSNGENLLWILIGVNVLAGRELQMANDKNYLVLTIKNDVDQKRIQMGGAFERHIPLVSRLADSLQGKPILWHTWNSKSNANKWASDKWFYLIEENINSA